MAAGDSIVVLGLLGQFPLTGIGWQLIHHLAGLQGLGFRVYYIEDTGTAPYDPRLRSPVGDCTYSLQFIAHALARIGMEHAWAYHDGLNGQWHGLSERRVQEVFSHAVCTHDVLGADSANQQGIGDERTMTATRHRFGAHQDDPFLVRQLDQFVEALLEFRRLHVIRIASKGSVAPAQVDRVAPSMAQPAQSRQVNVSQPGSLQ